LIIWGSEQMQIIIAIILILIFFPAALLLATGLILTMLIILAIGLLVWLLYRCYRKKEGKHEKTKIALCVALVFEFIILPIVGPENIIPTTIQYSISKNSWTGIIALFLIVPFLIAMLVDTFVLTPKLKPVHKKGL
jgi:Ca2+/Na+ antiporter